MPRIPHGAVLSLEAFQAALAAAPKSLPSVNMPLSAGALPDLHRFDYLFPTLQENDANFLPVSLKTLAALDRLGNLMRETGDGNISDSNIPAIYTYFGQFIDHDITFELASDSLRQINAPDLAPLPPDFIREKIMNTRTGTLELDSLYGPLPPITGQLVQPPRDGDLMVLGKVSERPPRPEGKDDFNDLPREARQEDRPKHDRAAIIGDPRNDENLIVGQLHLAFLRAHNAIVMRGHDFATARRMLQQHYQWIVIHDFLKRIADPAIVKAVLAGNKDYNPSPEEFFMPLEYSVAAYRFGHSMVRQEYDHNLNFNAASGTAATLQQLFMFTAFSGQLADFETVPENWIIEWERFIEGGRNLARPIDTLLVEPLFELRNELGLPLGDEARLAVRNLRRGYLLRIPTGQAVAGKLGYTPLTRAQIIAAAGNPQQAEVLDTSVLSERTPLWYYILAEAAHYKQQHLGPVGSHIVAEVLIGLIRRSENSILDEENWKPTLGPVQGQFTLPDLLRLAGVLQATQTRGVTNMSAQKKIIQKVREVRDVLKGDHQAAVQNSDESVAAINGGIISPAWETYMRKFAETPEQLARLLGTDGTLGDPVKDKCRTYLVANGTCGPGTVEFLDFGVNTIDDFPDPNIPRDQGILPRIPQE